MQKEIHEICAAVLKRVTPKKNERIRIGALARELEKRVNVASKALGVKAKVRLEGSVAKGTWLSGDPDIDIFMRVPTAIPRKSLGDVCLEVARRATKGSVQTERFAEHPYLEATVKGVRVNIVPCYDTELGELLSATDRTPFHTDYMQEHLSEPMPGEVRLLKKFMKGIGVYGAEIKIGGFSGYLTELLVLHYGSFVDTLRAFAKHKKRLIIDIEAYYKGREDELELLFKEPLVVVDPVDKGRNVASAVRSQKLFTLMAASRKFLESPSLQFFYPKKTTALKVERLKKKFENQGFTVVFVKFEGAGAVPDVLWGQLYKSQRSLRRLLELNDFKVLRTASWSDEKALNLFVFELEQRCLSLVRKHLGPPLEREHECRKFLSKYLGSDEVVSGPFIEDGRWAVEIRRKFTDAVALLKERLKDGGRNAGVAEKISKELRKGFKIFVNGEVVEIYRKNGLFAEFLTEFLSGEPKWLETAKVIRK